MNNKAIIINYRNMQVGGIENYAYQIMKHAMKEGYDVIWFSDVVPKTSNIYDDILKSDNLITIKCNTHRLHWFKHKNISFNKYENIIILSFSFFDHLRILELIKKEKLKNAIPYLITPHFTGGLMFPEQNFNILRKFVQRNVGEQYNEWIKSGEVLFLAKTHIDAIEKAYNIKIEKELKRMAPEYVLRRPFVSDLVLKKANQSPFKIVSAGRFEFPHKGYIIGLVDVVTKLINEKEDIELIIVGDGRDKKQLEEKVYSLKPIYRNRIKLLPTMPVDDLLDLYQKCNLSISVAGCASMGARIGLLTLPARHYTYNCEVYGFFPDSQNMTTSTEPGYNVTSYIKKVMNMTSKEYLELSKAAYNSFEDINVSIDDFINMNKNYFPYLPPNNILIKFKIIYYIDKLLFYLKKMRVRYE